MVALLRVSDAKLRYLKRSLTHVAHQATVTTQHWIMKRVRFSAQGRGMRSQGGSIIQQLRAKTGACIKIREEVVSLPSALPSAQPRLDLRIIAVSQPTTRLFLASMAMLHQ